MSNWVRFPTEEPPRDGLFLVHAPSADEEKPFIACAWWSAGDKCWGLIARIWAQAITHWMELPDPPDRSK